MSAVVAMNEETRRKEQFNDTAKSLFSICTYSMFIIADFTETGKCSENHI